jgi:ribosome biogenesis protein UTP30
MGAKTGTKSSKKTDAVKRAVSAKSSKPSKEPKFANTRLDSALVMKAVNAVLKYHEKTNDGSSDKLVLLGDDRPVQVQLTLMRAPGKSQPKPAQLAIPHPFYKLSESSDDNSDDVEEPEICLIVKDESKPWCLEMIEKFPDQMGCIKKVLTLDSLRRKHQSFEQKRQLLSKYNMFMADDRILPMMSKALGKIFIKAKKLPIPVNVTRESALPFAIQKALSATYMTVNTGTCISIRAGHTGMEATKLAANIMAIAKAAATKVPHSWANIQMIGVKTADSVSLPVYNKTPEALREIAKLAGVNTDAGVSADNGKTVEKRSSQSDQKIEKDKKKDLKSPLLQALKKQKKAELEKETLKKSKKEGKVEEKKTPEKKVKRSASPEPTSSTKKKQKKEEPVEEKKEKKDFIAAKKFKGAKKGYVFQMGQKGLGYYIDKIPVVDKMAVEAILRMGGSGGSKKSGKRRGRRR